MKGDRVRGRTRPSVMELSPKVWGNANNSELGTTLLTSETGLTEGTPTYVAIKV